MSCVGSASVGVAVEAEEVGVRAQEAARVEACGRRSNRSCSCALGLTGDHRCRPDFARLEAELSGYAPPEGCSRSRAPPWFVLGLGPHVCPRNLF